MLSNTNCNHIPARQETQEDGNQTSNKSQERNTSIALQQNNSQKQN